MKASPSSGHAGNAIVDAINRTTKLGMIYYETGQQTDPAIVICIGVKPPGQHSSVTG